MAWVEFSMAYVAIANVSLHPRSKMASNGLDSMHDARPVASLAVVF